MEISTTSSVAVPVEMVPVSPIFTELQNCSDSMVKSHPDDLVSELGYGILVLYGYAFLVVALTFGFFCK